MRLGLSNARTQPERKARLMTCQSATHSRTIRVASRKNVDAEMLWDRIMMRRRSVRSAMTPPNRVRAIVGAAKLKPVRPNSRGESVSSSTSQLCATPSMFCASTEESWPNQ
jgi:hypothetical protein